VEWLIINRIEAEGVGRIDAEGTGRIEREGTGRIEAEGAGRNEAEGAGAFRPLNAAQRGAFRPGSYSWLPGVKAPSQ
jgi:hypothetical protein